MKNIIKTTSSFFILFSFSIKKVIAGAPADGKDYITNPVIGYWGYKHSEGSVFAEYFITIWNAIMAIGALMVIIFFIKAALEWITAGEDKTKVTNARNTITQAVIGLIILVGSYVLISFISNLFFGDQFDILNPKIPGAVE